MIKVNGEILDSTELSLTKCLEEQGYRNGTFAVEVNEEIVPRGTYDQCTLHDGDVVEIVSLVGGG